MNNNLVRQYRAELFDENSKVVITSNTLLDVQTKVGNILDSEPRFEQKNTHTQVILDRKGGAVVGWINELEVPAIMALRPAAENRELSQQEAAA